MSERVEVDGSGGRYGFTATDDKGGIVIECDDGCEAYGWFTYKEAKAIAYSLLALVSAVEP